MPRHDDQDFLREIEAHVAHEADRLEGQGMARAEAVAAARRAFGNMTAVRERRRESSRFPSIDAFVQDLRLAARRFSRESSYAATAILTLGIAIGASTAIFSVVNAVALQPLPYRRPEEIVWFTQVLKMNTTDEVTITPDYLDWRRLVTSFTQIAAYNHQGRIHSADGVARRLAGARASAEVLPVLGVQPALGRNFNRQEDLKGSDRVAILMHGLWKRDFGGDPTVVGRKITLDDQPYEIVGVMPEGFRFPGNGPVEIITPLGKNEATELQRGPSVSIVLNVIGRLKPGATAAVARAELLQLQNTLPQMPWKPKIDILMMPLGERLLRDARRAGFALLGATLFLLLIACANVANLLLAQGARRERETAVRAAIGGSRGRLVSHVLVEASLMAGCAAMIGVAIAWAARAGLLALIPRGGFELSAVAIDARVLGFACVLGAATVLFSALGPAIRLSTGAPVEAMKRGSPAHTGSRLTRRLLLAVASFEIALTMVLLAGAALLMQSFLKMRYTGLGFTPERLIVATFTPRIKTTPHLLLDSLRGGPGIDGAAIGDSGALPPGYPSFQNNFCVEGRPVPPQGSRPTARVQTVGGDYFSILGIPILEGRAVAGPGPERPVTISKALARRLFGGQNPIGRRVGPCGGPPDWRTIVGVAGDTRTAGLAAAPESVAYFAAEQSGGFSEAAAVIRTSLPFEFAASEIRSRLQAIDAGQPVNSIRKMSERLDESAGQPRFVSVMAAVFALIALLLGATGIYAVMSCCARWRIREMAIRSALGASPGQVRSVLFRQGAVAACVGIVAGLALTLAMSKVLGSFLHEVSPRDPRTIAASAFLLATVAFAGIIVPAWRASSLAPSRVLQPD